MKNKEQTVYLNDPWQPQPIPVLPPFGDLKLVYSSERKLVVPSLGCKRAELKETYYRGVF